MVAANQKEGGGLTVMFAGKHGTREASRSLGLQISGPPCILKLPGSQQNGANALHPHPKQVTAQDLFMFLPTGSSVFHSLIYSPSNKCSPLSFTCSVLPFCHLIIHLAPWDSP